MDGEERILAIATLERMPERVIQIETTYDVQVYARHDFVALISEPHLVFRRVDWCAARLPSPPAA